MLLLRPFKVIVPLVPPHVVGSVFEAVLIAGDAGGLRLRELALLPVHPDLVAVKAL